MRFAEGYAVVETGRGQRGDVAVTLAPLSWKEAIMVADFLEAGGFTSLAHDVRLALDFASDTVQDELRER